MDGQLHRRRLVATAAALVAAAALALPVFAASPSPSPSPKAHGNGPAGNPDKSHAPETPITIHGTIANGTDADGRTTYTLQASGKTYDLSIGPPWFWGDKNPLDAYVGKTVTVAGDVEGADTDNASAATEVDVQSVDGKVLREPGKPPWAGGPKVVGPAHPGYRAWKDAAASPKP